MTPIRILVADDHALVRAGFRSLLEADPGIEVVGEAATGAEVLEQVARTQPDLVLMDVAMPEMTGLDAAERLRGIAPEIRVLIVSMYANEEYVLRALAAGAGGYLLKDADQSELQFAIRSVLAGGTYLSPAVAEIVGKGFGARRG